MRLSLINFWWSLMGNFQLLTLFEKNSAVCFELVFSYVKQALPYSTQ